MHTSLEILEIKLVLYLLFCCPIYNIRERVVSDIRTSSRRRELAGILDTTRPRMLQMVSIYLLFCVFFYYLVVPFTTFASVLYQIYELRAEGEN